MNAFVASLVLFAALAYASADPVCSVTGAGSVNGYTLPNGKHNMLKSTVANTDECKFKVNLEVTKGSLGRLFFFAGVHEKNSKKFEKNWIIYPTGTGAVKERGRMGVGMVNLPYTWESSDSLTDVQFSYDANSEEYSMVSDMCNFSFTYGPRSSGFTFEDDDDQASYTGICV